MNGSIKIKKIIDKNPLDKIPSQSLIDETTIKSICEDLYNNKRSVKLVDKHSDEIFIEGDSVKNYHTLNTNQVTEIFSYKIYLKRTEEESQCRLIITGPRLTIEAEVFDQFAFLITNAIFFNYYENFITSKLMRASEKLKKRKDDYL